MIKVGKKYKAIITNYAPGTSGEFQVFIPELNCIDPELKSITVKNKTSKYAKWFIEGNDSTPQSCGQYFPLYPGMNVDVMFKTSSAQSGEIVGLHYDNIPMTKNDEKGMYIIAKTVEGTTITTDDTRSVTQITHKKGLSNLILADDKVSMTVNEVSDAGTNVFSGMEINEGGITFKVGENALILDKTGVKIKIKDAVYAFTDKMFNLDTKSMCYDVDNFEVKAKKVLIQGGEELHLKSTVSRISGGQHLSLNGNVVNIDSMTNTTVQSNNNLTLKGLVSLDMESSMLFVDSLGMLSLNGLNTVVNGVTTVVNGSGSTCINGSTVFEDSMVIRGLGIASSISTTMTATCLSMKTTLKATNLALTSALHFTDPFSSMAANTLTLTLPGVAQSVPNQLPEALVVPSFDYVNSYLQYLNRGFKVGDLGTIDHVKSLSGSLVKQSYIPDSI